MYEDITQSLADACTNNMKSSYTETRLDPYLLASMGVAPYFVSVTDTGSLTKR
jgi:hypothetical protein